MKMKLTILTLTMATLLILPSVAQTKDGPMGQNGNSPLDNQENMAQERQPAEIPPTPANNQTQNQMAIQNQGEDSRLDIDLMEKERLGLGIGQNIASDETNFQDQDEVEIKNTGGVASQVQALLQFRVEGGIGDQVRQIAREQNQAQLEIQDQISKLDSKGKVARFLTGTDRQTVKTLKQHLEQNQLRIQQLENLQSQLTNQEDIAQLGEAIQLITNQNTSLQERVMAEDKSGGLFGWLIDLFEKISFKKTN